MQVTDDQIKQFVNSQIEGASGMRLERLKKDLTGEKKMLKEIIVPALQSFDGLVLEYEVIGLSGYRYFIDVCYVPLMIAFESEGFVVHAETITRDRFTFERARVRALAEFGYTYVPFSWDEMDKNPAACRSSVYSLLGKLSHTAQVELSLYEREVLRQARVLNRPFRIADVEGWLTMKTTACRKVIQHLADKGMIMPYSLDKQRVHAYVLK